MSRPSQKTSPASPADKTEADVLRRMLATPPKPHEPKPTKKPSKKP